MQNSRKWIVGALVVSVALNLALGGFVAGRLLEPRMGPPRMDPSLALFPMLRDLPDARRDELRPLLRAEFRQARGEMRRMRAAQRDIRSALGAEPFSDAELAAALAAFRTALLASQEGSHAALVRLAQALTPEERLKLAAAMREAPRRHFGPREGRMPPPAPPGGPGR